MSITPYPPQEAALGSAAFEDYDEGEFVVTATGLTTTVSGPATYVKIGRLVVIVFPDLIGTSNATTMTVTGLPAPLAVALATRTFFQGNANGVVVHGMMHSVGTTIDCYSSLAFGGWTATGDKGLYAPTMIYLTA